MRSNMNKYRKSHRRPMIFVFGSNERGIHGAGAARYALLHHGAVMGMGVGMHGNSYAIPTKGNVSTGKGIGSTLPLKAIQNYVDDFLRFARANPQLIFQVTRIGCGLAGLKDEWVAPMFKDAPINCHFDMEWLPYLETGDEYSPKFLYWGTF